MESKTYAHALSQHDFTFTDRMLLQFDIEALGVKALFAVLVFCRPLAPNPLLLSGQGIISQQGLWHSNRTQQQPEDYGKEEGAAQSRNEKSVKKFTQPRLKRRALSLAGASVTPWLVVAAAIENDTKSRHATTKYRTSSRGKVH